MREVSEATKDAFSFITASKEEISFLRRQIDAFKQLSDGIASSLAGFAETFEEKSGRLLADWGPEKKRNYKGLMGFVLGDIQAYFAGVARGFRALLRPEAADFSKKLAAFQASELPTLSARIGTFESAFTAAKEARDGLKARKDAYFDYVCALPPQKLSLLLNFRVPDDPEFEKVRKREESYVKSLHSANKTFEVFVAELKGFLSLYEETIRQKFEVVYFSLLGPRPGEKTGGSEAEGSKTSASLGTKEDGEGAKDDAGIKGERNSELFVRKKDQSSLVGELKESSNVEELKKSQGDKTPETQESKEARNRTPEGSRRNLEGSPERLKMSKGEKTPEMFEKKKETGELDGGIRVKDLSIEREKTLRMMREFRLHFRDIRTELYLQNPEVVFERHFPLQLIIEEQSKSSQVSIRRLHDESTALQRKLGRGEAGDLAGLLAVVVALDLHLPQTSRGLNAQVAALPPIALLLCLTKLKRLVMKSGPILVGEFALSLLGRVAAAFYAQQPQTSYDIGEVLRFSRCWFFVGSRVFLKPPRPPRELDRVALHRSRECFIFLTENFWRAFFQEQTELYAREPARKKNPKLSAAEKIAFFCYLTTGDLTIAAGFARRFLQEAGEPPVGIELRVRQKLALKFKAFQPVQLPPLPISRSQRLLSVLKISLARGFLPPSTPLEGLFPPGRFNNALKLEAIKAELRGAELSGPRRSELWAALLNLAAPRPSTKRHVRSSEREQIRLDVNRTKQERGEGYRAELFQILVEFFEEAPERLEYFQGLNYLASFFLDSLGGVPQAKQALRFLARGFIAEFFTDSLCDKVNLVCFQLDHLVARHFPSLAVHWRNLCLGAEMLFSGFVIALFTNFSLPNTLFVREFWDLILVEEWRGVVKCILFLLNGNLPRLLASDIDATLSFFTEIKTDEKLAKPLIDSSFKRFANAILLDEQSLRGLEDRFRAEQD